jgi:hypothetical protein
LGILGFAIVKSPLRWGLLAATLLGIFMTWGKYFAGFNVFFFEHLPLYNKFRSPSFAQVIPQFTLGIMAALTLQAILFADNSKEFLQKNFKPILYTIGAVFILLGLLYIGMDYGTRDDGDILAQAVKQTGTDELGRLIVSALKSERKAMFGGQILRALGLVLLGAVILFAYAKNKIKAPVAAIILLLISTLDITITSYKYFNNENDHYADRPDDEKLFVAKDDYDRINFSPTAIDNQLLQDKSLHYRVFNMLGTKDGSPFSESRTSYYHRSVGGYHPAKLRIYQDIIEKYLQVGQTQSGRIAIMNPNYMSVLNMLDTKYTIEQDEQTGQPVLKTNPNAFGPCWLVKNVKIVDSRVAAIVDIGRTNLKDTAIVENIFSKDVVQPQWDSASSIKMTKFDNDAIEYEADCIGPQFAVFSEIYYPVGWNAYLDGRKAAYCNTNYILRGLSIPAGKHTVKFIFEPDSVKKGRSVMFISSILVMLVLIGGFFMAWRQSRKTT